MKKVDLISPDWTVGKRKKKITEKMPIKYYYKLTMNFN